MAKKVLSAEINHETNTFSIVPTTIESFRKGWYYKSPEIPKALGGTRSRIGAHIDAARNYGWDILQPIAALATPSGRSTANTWAELSSIVLKACEENHFDGVLLALHGAMVTEDQDDAEGDILARIRERIGSKVPIAITLDLHANVTDTMASLADIIIGYKTYPHIDGYESAMETADLLNQAMEGRIQPHAIVARGPLLSGCDYGRTQGGPMSEILEKAATYKAHDPSVLAIAICAGFPWSDVLEAGPSVTVTGEGRNEKLVAIANDLMSDIWAKRHEITERLVGIDEAVDTARKACKNAGQGPLILADFSDNPGHGGYGDGVRLLRAMIEADLSNAAFASVVDPHVVQECVTAGKGAKLHISLGAKTDPQKYGPSLDVSCILESISDGLFVCDGPMRAGVKLSLGQTAVLRAGNVRFLVTTNNVQVFDQQVFLSQGIEPKACSVLGLKSFHHFRAAFDKIAVGTLLVDSGGLLDLDLRRLNYYKVRRPIYPLDID